MRVIGTSFLALALCVTVGWCALAGAPAQREGDKGKKKPAAKLPVGKDTTYVTGPLDKDGYIDYERALNERLGKGVKPEDNANVLLWKALGPKPEGSAMPPEYFRWLGVPAPPDSGDYFVGLDAYLKGRPGLDQEKAVAVRNQLGRACQRPWSARDYPHIAGWLKANEKPLAVAVEASGRSGYFNPLLSRKPGKGFGGLLATPLPGTQKCREVALALAARALLRAGEGNPDEAWQDLLACHRLGRLVARGATLIEALVGIAIERIATNADLGLLGQGRLTAKQIRGCLRDLQRLPPLPLMADKIDLGERFIFLDAAQLVRRGGVNTLKDLAGGPAPKDPDPTAQQALDAIDWAPALRYGNRWYDRMVAAMRVKDRAEQEKQFGQIEEDLEAMKKAADADTLARLLKEEPLGRAVGVAVGSVLIRLLIPAAHKMQQAGDRAEQAQRNLHVAFAIAAYHREHRRYPEKLAALAPDYLAQVPGDLFSGKALIYRRSERGYLLYSVGVNARDDGGRSDTDDPAGDDLRVAMPLQARNGK